MKYLTILMFLCLAVLSGCAVEKPTPIVPNEPTPCSINCDTSKIQLLWAMPLEADTIDCGSKRPITWNGNVGFMQFFASAKELFKWRDGKNGKKLWSWEDISGEITGDVVGSITQQNNLLAVCSWREINMIDLNTGKNIWRTDTKDKNGRGFPRTKIINNHIYHTNFRENGKTFSDVAYLVRSPLQYPKWDTLLTLEQNSNNNYNPFIEMPSLYSTGKGDSILVFQNRQIHDITTVGKVDIYAFDLKTRKYKWKLDSIENNSSVFPPTIFNDKIYFLGSKILFCIDPNDGKIIWKWNIPTGNFHADDILVAENKIYIHSANSRLYCIDPNTGSLIWSASAEPTSNKGMRYYKGIIFYTGSALIGFDAKTGEQKIKILAPKHKYKYTNSSLVSWGLEIDEKNGLLYCADNRYALCFKLNF